MSAGPVRPSPQVPGGPRGVGPGVAAARGYSTTVMPAWLHEQGFPHAVAPRTPGLATPVRDTRGAIQFHQYQPEPRMLDGKVCQVRGPGVRLAGTTCPRPC